MEETSGKNNADQESLSMQATEAPINFLQRFSSGNPDKARSSTNSEEVDLSLNLSLGGPYGQNGGEKTLTRSSSIAGDITQRTVTNGSLGGGYSGVRLEKSCSLPAKAERVLMRFGDLQTMRRAETGKRLLLEKQRRAAKAAKAAETEKAPAVNPPPAVVEGQPVSHEAAAWGAASAYNSPALNGTMDKVKYADPKHEDEGLSGSTKQALTAPAVSVEKEKLPRPAGTTSENASKRFRFSMPKNIKDDEMLKKMPSVTTTGDGPNGRRIEGVLYNYLDGHVWIVCVCHGQFFTPAEFVRHAGATNVDNPMRRITVYPVSL